MNELVDDPRAVRPGEELDSEALRTYLANQLGEDIEELAVEQFPGGHSNLTYLVRWRPGGSKSVREYVLRRPPYGSHVAKAHDMAREHRVLDKLAPVFGKAPRPLLYCHDPAVIGGEFYLMERMRGVILRRDPPASMGFDAVLARRLCEVLIDALVELHALDFRAIGLGDLGKPDGYVARQVGGWTERYRAAETEDIAAMHEIARWLAGNMPRSGAPALIHNDFKFDNLILDRDQPTRIVGILDWEMCTLGDPLMDLGTSLAYWIEAGDGPVLQKARFGPTPYPGMMTRAEVVDTYAEKSGRDGSPAPFYYCFGLFKTAVVVQQIYYRYIEGHTSDPRFASMGMIVKTLAEQASEVIARDRISW